MVWFLTHRYESAARGACQAADVRGLYVNFHDSKSVAKSVQPRAQCFGPYAAMAR